MTTAFGALIAVVATLRSTARDDGLPVFDEVEAEIRRLDVNVDQKLAALDDKVGALAIGIERIATLLGLGSVIPSVPTGPPAST